MRDFNCECGVGISTEEAMYGEHLCKKCKKKYRIKEWVIEAYKTDTIFRQIIDSIKHKKGDGESVFDLIIDNPLLVLEKVYNAKNNEVKLFKEQLIDIHMNGVTPVKLDKGLDI